MLAARCLETGQNLEHKSHSANIVMEEFSWASLVISFIRAAWKMLQELLVA